MVVDGKPHVRPCVSIPHDGNEGNDWIASIGDLYALLTMPLPLAGASMLTRVRRGSEPRIAASLRAEAPWLAAAIDRVADQAAMQLWAGRPWLAIRPMLLVGPPGSGKTHFARQLGALSGCGSAILSLAGISNNAELAGSPRGFRHPTPAFPATAMLRTGTANPVIVMDEIEKGACSDLGDPIATLLGLTSALWQAVARDFGLPPSALPPIEAAAEAMLIRLFRNTRSVRRLRRAIETLVAVSARHVPRTVN